MMTSLQCHAGLKIFLSIIFSRICWMAYGFGIQNPQGQGLAAAFEFCNGRQYSAYPTRQHRPPKWSRGLSATIDVPSDTLPDQDTSKEQADTTTTTDLQSTRGTDTETNGNSKSQETHDDSALDVLAGNVAACLYKSDLKRDDGRDGASTGWTSWVDGEAALRLQSCMDALELPTFIRNPTQQQQQQQQQELYPSDLMKKMDEAVRWIRWIKACPSPLIMELSAELRDAVNATIINEEFLTEIDTDRNSFLERIGCRLFVLPSGASLSQSLRAPAGAMIYGKLLLGGVTRFRMIGSNGPRRRAGARTLITSPQEARTAAWLQYGGPKRNYEAVDAGACAFMEVLILPKGLSLPLVAPIRDMECTTHGSSTVATETPLEEVGDTTISQIKWDLHNMLDLVSAEQAEAYQKQFNQGASQSSLSEAEAGQSPGLEVSGKDFLLYLESSFTASVGGLQPQIDSIIRRVLDGRAMTSTSESSGTEDGIAADAIRRKEMEALLDLGLQPVRGLLLYGPPGTGKTLVAREIANVLTARKPKIVAAPELLDRWVGGSERLVRELFQDAEEELRACKDPTESALHVIVIDEIDAVFRKRSASTEDGGGEVTRASAVNQILAKLDGVKELGNILLIGMTNRRELLDEALLRPGRLEVQVEIPLPDREGRREILNIHFEALRRRGLLSKSLCDAIDGSRKSSNSRNRRPSLSLFRKSEATDPATNLWHRRIRDLASDRWTQDYSGADIAGLVRASGSLALARARKQDGGGLENLLITLEDVAQALEELRQ